jgi:hypothetical protein
MAESKKINVRTVETAWDSREVTACCAPMTSVFSLLTSAPVCARAKKARGCCCTCANTLPRSS